jgi:outer membrane protein assembly factor BamB
MKPLASADPTSVGSYRLLGVLGGGGMGRVYLGRSPSGRRVAVKVIRSELAEDPVFRRRFAREVAAIRSVGPLFTAPMVDADPEAEPPWLATTYVEGPSLREWVVEHGPLAAPGVLVLAAGLAEALASIHAAGLVHRDLKPSNVLLDDAGPRIIDFGIVALPDATSPLTTSIIGTPSYLAPELIDGAEASAASDIFALGATLYFAATGRPLVGEGTMFQQMTQIAVGRFDLSGVPKAVRPAIIRCLSRRPKDRPTADELARIFVSTGGTVPGPGWYRPTGPAAVEPAGHVSRRRVLVLGGAVGLAVVGGGMAAAFGRDGGRRPGAVPPPGPGTVLWSVRSGAQPPAAPVMVDGLITATAAQLVAVDRQGRRRWTRDLPGGAVAQRPWDDAVLITDLGTAALVDAATGTPRFTADLAGAERAASRDENPDHLAVEIGAVVTGVGHAYLDLGTATVAIDRQGHQVWRRPRATQPDGRRTAAPVPLAAGPERLVLREVVDGTVQISLADPDTGQVRWSTRYAAPPPGSSHPPPGPPPDGGPPPPDGGPPPGGPPPDEAWNRSEARLGPSHLALRDIQDLRVVRAADGGTVWRGSSPTPVAAIELVGDLLVVSADRLTARHVPTGDPAWQAPIRGSRIAVAPDGGTVVAATEQEVTALDAAGRVRWRTKVPGTVTGAVPDTVTIQDGIVYVTFRGRPDRHQPLDTDVVAFAL